MDQRSFIQLAKRELGLGGYELAETLGVSRRAFDKWMVADARSADFRAAPTMAYRFVATLLRNRKRDCLAQGDRESAETIDAILSQVDPAALNDALMTFDTLQRSALARPQRRLAGKPGYFASLQAKNEWDEEELIANARETSAHAG
jgi:hypothetical protein